MPRILLLVAIFALMEAARSFTTREVGTGGAGVLAFGFVTLAAYFCGSLFASFRLPRLTGYIACGILVGPYALGLLGTGMVDKLRLFNGVAISLIALTAGSEMGLRELRPLLKTIGWISLVGVVGTSLLLGGAIFLVRGWLPFLAELELGQAIAVSLVLGVTTVAQSPAVVVAVRDELRAEGPVSRTALGVVVIGDLVVIVLFALTSSYAQLTLGHGADLGETARRVSWELFGSLGVGAVLGLVLSVYLRYVRDGIGLFVLVTCVAIAEVGVRLHLDPLLVALAAGMVVRNVGGRGEQLLHAIHGASMPVYVVFFAVAGATLHLDVIPLVLAPASVIILVRAAGLLTGSAIGARLASAPASVQRWAGFGLLPQAGLALALALLFVRTFPEFGAGAQALVLGVVAINEIVAPAFYRWSLLRAGEATGPADTGAEATAEVAPH